MEQDLQKFSNYVLNNYDINNRLINEKYLHSIRVSMLMIDLALRLNLSDEDVRLAFQIGLFHDLGRFKEVILHNKFNNLIFDHGAYSNKILFNDGFINEFDIKENDYLTIRKALYFHNKKDLDNRLNEREKLFSKMIRDTDKLDIINVMLPKGILSFTKKHNKIVLSNYFSNEKIDLKNLKSSSDRVILYLSFLKDLYFEETKEMAIERRDLNKMICGIPVSYDNKELFNHLVSKVYEDDDNEETKCLSKKSVIY